MNKVIFLTLTVVFLAVTGLAGAQTTTDHEHTRPPYSGLQKKASKNNIPVKHSGHYKPRKQKPTSSHVEVR